MYDVNGNIIRVVAFNCVVAVVVLFKPKQQKRMCQGLKGKWE